MLKVAVVEKKEVFPIVVSYALTQQRLIAITSINNIQPETTKNCFFADGVFQQREVLRLSTCCPITSRANSVAQVPPVLFYQQKFMTTKHRAVSFPHQFPGRDTVAHPPLRHPPPPPRLGQWSI